MSLWTSSALLGSVEIHPRAGHVEDKPSRPGRGAKIESSSASPWEHSGCVWGHQGIRTPLATTTLLHLQPQDSNPPFTLILPCFFAGCIKAVLVHSAWVTGCPQPRPSWTAHLVPKKPWCIGTDFYHATVKAPVGLDRSPLRYYLSSASRQPPESFCDCCTNLECLQQLGIMDRPCRGVPRPPQHSQHHQLSDAPTCGHSSKIKAQ